MRFIKIVYLAFILFWLSSSNLYIGPITIKMFLAILLFLGNLIIDKRIVLDSIVKVYCLFLLSLGIACSLTGHLDYFFNIFLRSYLIAIIGWRATIIILQRDPAFIKHITYVVMFIGLFDTFVTVSQFTMSVSWYAPIEKLFCLPTYEDYVMKSDNLIGEVYTRFIPGIFGNPVVNGYYLAICTVLSFYYLNRYKSLWLFIIPIFFIIGCFCCQERSALGIAILLSMYLIYKHIISLKKTKRFIYVIFSLIIIVYIGLYMYERSSILGLRYTELGSDDGGRFDIYHKTIDYLCNNFFTPNIIDLIQEVGHAPHNLFLNAFVYGGCLSFLSIMIILYKQTKLSFDIIKKINKHEDYSIVIFVCAWLAFTLNGLVHNKSIVTGELICWVLWAIIQVNYNYLFRIRTNIKEIN